MESKIDILLKGEGGKTEIIAVQQDTTVENFFTVVSTKLGYSKDEIRIGYAGKQLQTTRGLKLTDYHVENNASMFLMFRLRGGRDPDEGADEIPAPKVTPLPEYVEVVKGEKDMLSLEDDDSERAKMSCGHVLGPESMTQWALSLIDNRKYKFICPHPNCEEEWPYFVVCHVAHLTVKEQEELDTGVTANFMKQSEEFQQCPFCKSWSFRGDTASNRVRCIVCKKKGQKDTFCWVCLREWKTSHDKFCGHGDCNSPGTKLEYLRICPEKKVYEVLCPEVRACPLCGMLIQHSAACKHMTCKSCKGNFCFVCLKPKKDGKWQCGGYDSPCEAAARQTTLPS